MLVIGGPGIVQAVGAGRATVVDEGPADAVVVGFTRDFDFAALHRAQSAILGGARLIGTNDDATYPTPDGPIPGGGALLAAVAKASGHEPVVAGKPYEPMAALVHAEVGPLGAGSMMVGDRLETDGDFAARARRRLRSGPLRRHAPRPGGRAAAGLRRARPRRAGRPLPRSRARHRLTSAAGRPCRGAARVIVCGRDARRLLQMTSNDLIKRLIDAGLSFTQMSQAKAEEIAKDLQEAGQLRVDEAQATVQELMARGRENTENLMRLVQREVSKQLESMGVDLSDLEARVEDLAARVGIRTPGGGSSAAAASSAACVDGHEAHGQEGSSEEDHGEAGTGQEDDGQEGPGQEDHGQAGTGEEDGRQEDHRQEGDRPRRRRPRRPPAADRPPAGRPQWLRGDRPPPPRHRARPAGPRPEPHRRAGGHRRAPRDRRRVARRASRPTWSRPATRVELLGPPARFVGRGGEKLDAALERFGSTSPTCGPSTPARRPAASPTASCSGARRRWWPSTSATASSTRRAGRPARRRPRAHQRAAPDAGSDRRPGRPGGGRPVVHLAAAVLPALLAVAAPGAPLVLLVKPQFEAGRAEVARGSRRGPRPGGAPGRPGPASMTPCARVGRPSWAGWNLPCAARTATSSSSSTRWRRRAGRRDGRRRGRGDP